MGGVIKPLSYNWCVILWVGRCQKSNYPYIMMYERKPFFVIWLSKNFGYCQFRSANGPRVPWSSKLMTKMKAQQMITAFTLMVFFVALTASFEASEQTRHFYTFLIFHYVEIFQTLVPLYCTIWISFVVPDDYHCVGVKWNPFQLLQLDSQMVAKNAGGPKCE